MLSQTEENYLKALLKITLDNEHGEAGTNELAASLSLKPATVNDMLKKLKEKQFIAYEKYGKITLTALGKKHGWGIVRKHRLWETFLFEKLDFSWDEVHEVAEQLEHIQSVKLIDKLDQFLGYPSFDPHGDPIPTHKGVVKIQYKKLLVDAQENETYKVLAVKDNSSAFLQYVAKVGIQLNCHIKVKSIQTFDGMMHIEVDGKKSTVSQKFAQNIFIE